MLLYYPEKQSNFNFLGSFRYFRAKLSADIFCLV